MIFVWLFLTFFFWHLFLLPSLLTRTYLMIIYFWQGWYIVSLLLHWQAWEMGERKREEEFITVFSLLFCILCFSFFILFWLFTLTHTFDPIMIKEKRKDLYLPCCSNGPHNQVYNHDVANGHVCLALLTMFSFSTLYLSIVDWNTLINSWICTYRYLHRVFHFTQQFNLKVQVLSESLFSISQILTSVTCPLSILIASY